MTLTQISDFLIITDRIAKQSGEGNVFTGVCHTVHKGGGGVVVTRPPGHTAPKEGKPGIRLIRGQCASYWNAFLFEIKILLRRTDEKSMPTIIVNISMRG